MNEKGRRAGGIYRGRTGPLALPRTSVFKQKDLMSSLQDTPTLHPNSLKFRVKSSPSVTEKSNQDVQGHLENTWDRCAAASGQRVST